MSTRLLLCYFEGCGKSFGTAHSLQRHEFTHLKTKPFRCTWTWCNQSFAQKMALSIHMNTHTGEKPYSCEHCEARFADPSSLSRHRSSHFAPALKCLVDTCVYTTRRKTSLSKHLQSQHGVEAILPRFSRRTSKVIGTKSNEVTPTRHKTTSRNTSIKAQYLSSPSSSPSSPRLSLRSMSPVPELVHASHSPCSSTSTLVFDFEIAPEIDQKPTLTSEEASSCQDIDTMVRLWSSQLGLEDRSPSPTEPSSELGLDLGLGMDLCAPWSLQSHMGSFDDFLAVPAPTGWDFTSFEETLQPLASSTFEARELDFAQWAGVPQIQPFEQDQYASLVWYNYPSEAIGAPTFPSFPLYSS